MDEGHRRQDIKDELWRKIEDHLPGKKGKWEKIAEDNRQFINAVLWIFRTGGPWRDLPPDYGGWKNKRKRFCRWRDKGMWESLLEIMIFEAEYDWLMIDSTFIKAHKSAIGARGCNQKISRTKGGSTPKYIWPWIMVC